MVNKNKISKIHFFYIWVSFLRLCSYKVLLLWKWKERERKRPKYWWKQILDLSLLFSLKMLLLIILFSIKVSTQPNIFSTHLLKEGLELFPKKIKDSWKFTKQFWEKSSKKDDTKVEPDGITDVELPCKSSQCTNEICATKVSRKKKVFHRLSTYYYHK